VCRLSLRARPEPSRELTQPRFAPMVAQCDKTWLGVPFG